MGEGEFLFCFGGSALCFITFCSASGSEEKVRKKIGSFYFTFCIHVKEI